MKTKLREDQKRLQVSNPASGFTVTLDPDCDKHLGGLYTMTNIYTRKLSDGSVRVRIFKDNKGLHRVVKRTSGNRYAKTRIVDRHDAVKAFPDEFGPTLVRYSLMGTTCVEFIVPPPAERRAPITRLQKETKLPLLEMIKKEPELVTDHDNLFEEFVDASRRLRALTDKILDDPEVSKLVKERFFESQKTH